MPQPLAVKLFAEETDNDIDGFVTAEEFERERKRRLGGD